MSCLTAFAAVARHGSFSAAAAAMDLTPGAVSRQVSALEAQLRQKLVLRTGKGISLTDRGAAYAQEMDDILTRIRMLSLEMMSDDMQNALGLAVLPTFGTRWLFPRIPDFVRRYPKITISFATRIGQFDFTHQGLDAAIHVGRPDWPGCHCELLMHETVVPVCSPDFLADNPIASPERLLGMPLLEMQSRPDAWSHWFETFGVKASYRRGMRFEQLMNVAQACCAGLGVALMPPFLIASELETGQLVEVADWSMQSPSSYYFVYPEQKRHHTATMRFLEWLKDQIARAELDRRAPAHT